MKIYFQLFVELFRIALFVIGGGYAILAVADQVFAKRKWTRDGELLDELPVFQMVPGIIATHTAVYIGRKMAGWKGAVVGVVAVALPSVIIFTLVSMGYDSLPLENPHVVHASVGLRCALTGIVGATVVRSFQCRVVLEISFAIFHKCIVGCVRHNQSSLILRSLAQQFAAISEIKV